MRDDIHLSNWEPGASRAPIILDCDEVLLGWVPGFRRFLRERHGIAPMGRKPAGLALRPWLGIQDQLVLRRIMLEFNNSPAHGFGGLAPMPGALEAVRELAAAGRELHVVSSCTDMPQAAAARRENLRSVFGTGTFRSIECLPLWADKTEAYSAHRPGLVVDDLPHNLAVAEAAGHTPALLSIATDDVEASRMDLP